MDIKQRVENLQSEIQNFEVKTKEQLESFRIKFIGSKGALKDLFGELKNVPNDGKKLAGNLINTLKQETETLYNSRKEELDAVGEKVESIDFSRPGAPVELGAHHPISLIRSEIISIFERIGYIVSEGPEIEDDWHNFEALNIPAHHPARAMHDTFYFADGRVLRTHTSPVQIRTMVSQTPPIRIVAPGRVYRCDHDLTHTPMFHQIE